jgi:hypothetical protein
MVRESSDDANVYQIQRAFAFVHATTGEEDIASFKETWGGLDQAAFLRAFNQGKGTARLVALFYLGLTAIDLIKETLIALLSSPDPFERWASAMMLGEQRQEEALPVLMELLTEVPPVETTFLEEAEIRVQAGSSFMQPIQPWDSKIPFPTLFEGWRSYVVSLLGRWKRPQLVPFLRQAFETLRQRALTETDLQEELYRCLDYLTYALGGMEAFGALMGLDLSEQEVDIAMVHMVCGYLDTGTRYGKGILPYRVFYLLENVEGDAPEFRQECDAVLEQRFGLNGEQRQRVAREFYSFSEARIKNR